MHIARLVLITHCSVTLYYAHGLSCVNNTLDSLKNFTQNMLTLKSHTILPCDTARTQNCLSLPDIRTTLSHSATQPYRISRFADLPNVTLRKHCRRGKIKCDVFSVRVGNLSSPPCKSHATCYTVTCDLSDTTVFLHIIS